MTKRNTEWSPMWRDANESVAQIEARTAALAPDARAYLARVGALDVAQMLGVEA